jgi:hypothetical protein
MPYPPYTLNYIDAANEKARIPTSGEAPTAHPATFEKIAQAARTAVNNGLAVQIKGSHTFTMESASGLTDIFMSHHTPDDEEPTINIVIRAR